MANMIDYLVWRGDISLEASPWCSIDSLLTATLSYLGFHGNSDGWTLSEAMSGGMLEDMPGSASFPNRKRAFEWMATSNRFGSARMHHYIAVTDPEREMQFSAMCLDLPDGSMAVAFRGTDNTIVGWKEDFNMAYQVSVPAQEVAAYYLKRAAEYTTRPLRIMGHSKGGNLAVFAASCVPEEVQDRILEIDSFDGPGLNREISESAGHLRIRGKIRSYIPQTSIIGLLMEYYEPYTVVHSTASGISQHDPMTWQVYGPMFEVDKSIDQSAVLIRDTLHEWLETCPPEERGTFVETLFRYVDSTKATRMSDLTGEKWKSLVTMFGSRKEVDPATRRVFNRLMAQAVTLGFGNVMERVRGRKEADGEAPEEALPEAGAPETAEAPGKESGKEQQP